MSLKTCRDECLRLNVGVLVFGTLALQGLFSMKALAEENAVSTWNPRSTLHLSGGLQFMATKEQDKWNVRKPLFAQLSQSFTLVEASGEWDLGGSFFYLGGAGKKAIPGNVAAKPTSKTGISTQENASYNFMALGLALISSYRFAYAPHPGIAPRLGVMVGVAQQDQDTLMSDFTVKNKRFFKPLIGLRGSLEFSLLGLNSSEGGLIGYGYGIDDMVITGGGSYLFDVSPKESYKVQGFTAELGLGLLFI